MKLANLLLTAMLCTSAASAIDLRKAFVDLHKKPVEMLLDLNEKVLDSHQRLLLDKELKARESRMTYKQKERYYRHPSEHRAQGKGHGRKHAPGQQKKHH
jgi:hypothetical protein